MADSSEKVSFLVDMQCSSLRAEAFLVFDKGSQPTLGQQITDSQPTVGRLLAEKAVNDSRPTVGRLFFGGAVLHFFPPVGLINFPEVLINFKAFSGGSKSALNKTLILITLESIRNLFESNSAERINREGLVRGDKIPFDGLNKFVKALFSRTTLFILV